MAPRILSHSLRFFGAAWGLFWVAMRGAGAWSIASQESGAMAMLMKFLQVISPAHETVQFFLLLSPAIGAFILAEKLSPSRS